MNRMLSILTAFLILPSVLLAGQRIQLADSDSDIEITVKEATVARTVVEFDIAAYTGREVSIDGKTYYDISIPDEGVITIKGEPSLPKICRSIIIPDDAHMRINVLDSQYQDFASIPVAPSKGHIKRTENPEDIPYEFGEIYNADKWYPSKLADIREPYILRDLRGTVIEIYPFQYNPQSQTLRIYTSLTVEVVADGPGLANVFDRQKPFSTVDPSFESIYKEHFINYNQGTLLYIPVRETGGMLIISYDSFSDEMQPLVEWKRQKGIKTTLVNVSSIGNNATSIGNFIQAFYDSTNLAWVLLVGDAAQVATPYASGGAADPTYAKVVGNDYYPDIFIGRFSAENANQVITQVERTINYEKYPQGGADWYHTATGIASDLGPGHYGEYDYQHMNNIRTDLLGYNYTLVDQIYDPSANPAMVTAALNPGRSFLNYVGHGSVDGWGSSDFSNSDVNNLTNDYRLPFIFSVACVNGDFDGATCFGEAWLRATDNSTGNPTGAMATYMSSINQDWDPPMYAQDEATDRLVAESSLTFGGICYNGSCYMIDVEGSTGANHFNTWHIFGDPSVMLTTDTPAAMTVTHDASVIFTATQYNVTVSGIEGALCALYHEGTLYGSAYTNSTGNAAIDIAEQLPIAQTITLTVTAYNKLPYFADIAVISPAGPYIVYDQCTVDDHLGNDNGLVDFGESIGLDMQLKNVGPDDATNVSAVLSSPDSFVTITDANADFGTIYGGDGTVNISGAYAFDVAADIPDNYTIPFHLEITGDARDTWTGDFAIQAHTPILEFGGVSVNDQAGNGNGILEAGETAQLTITMLNNGSGEAYAVQGNLREGDSYVTVNDSSGAFGNIAGYGSGDNAGDIFTVTAGGDFPQGHTVVFTLNVLADGGYATTMQFELRTVESFEYDNGGYAGSGNWQWGEPTAGPPGAYYGTRVWGTILTGDYQNNRNDYLVSSPMHIYSSDAVLEFYQWYNIEDYYDGGNVQISTNNGTTWTLITPEGGYPSSNIYALNQAGYTNTSGGWVQARFDLTSYADRDVLFRWRFASDSYVTEDGWYIDDVTLANNIPPIFPEVQFDVSSLADSLVEDEQAVHNIVVINNGDAPLSISFSSDDTWIQVEGGPYSIAPAENTTLQVTLDATGMACGNHAGALAFSCNDPVTPSGSIPVTLHVYYPDIALGQTEIDDSLNTGEQLVTYIPIANTAIGRLHYTVDYEEAGLAAMKTVSGTTAKAQDAKVRIALDEEDIWLFVSPSEDSIEGGETDSLEVTLDASAIDAGTYNGTITINSNDPDEGTIIIPVTLNVTEMIVCDYTPGDINGGGGVIGADVTYAINYFRNIGPPPPDSCYHEQTDSWLYVAGDCNGDCRFIGSDITFLVGYFRGINPVIQYCPDLPPLFLPRGVRIKEGNSIAK